MTKHTISGSVRLVAERKEDAALLCHTLHALPALGQVDGVTVVCARPKQGRRNEWLVSGTAVVVGALALFGGLVYWIFYASLNADTFPAWTGFNTRPAVDDAYPARTLWDWLSLLLVPVVLAVGGLLFT